MKLLNKLSALVMGGALLFAGAAGAAAADTPAYQIDTQKTGSITVHKYKNPTETGTPDGKEITAPESVAKLGETLDGVTFKITPVKKADGSEYDFSKNADILEVSKLTAADVIDLSTSVWKDEKRKGTLAEGLLSEGQTAQGGILKFENLPVGVYLIEETNAPEGVVKAVPFLAVVPTTDPAALNTWMYDLHVYPKNTSLDAEKTVADKDQHQANKITYTILTDVPVAKSDPEENIVSYSVLDELNTNGATAAYTAESVKSVEIIKKESAEVVGAALTAGETADYAVTVETGKDGVENHKLTVDFKDAGLTTLSAESRKGEALQVRTTIELEIGADFNVAAGIVNEAELVTKPSNDSDIVRKPTEEVKSYFGKIKLIKHKADDENTKLQGAEFKIYADADLQNELFANQTFATDENGEITFPVVHVNDYENNLPVDAEGKGYWLVETKAPAGYELLTEPVFVQVKTTDVLDDAQTIVSEVKVPNAPSNTPKLPLTGGAGIAAIILVGAALVGGALVWLRKSTNKA